jgi:uncharacterized membrane protein YeiH
MRAVWLAVEDAGAIGRHRMLHLRMDLNPLHFPDIAREMPNWLALSATAAGALLGGMLGRERSPKVDIAGLVILAGVLGYGGGLIRDILIGNTPPAAFVDPAYTVVVGICVVAVLLFGRFFSRFKGVLIVLDALTLGLFAAVGAQAALSVGLPGVSAVVIGVFAATGGGVLAALLLDERPQIMVPGPPYVVVAFAGAVLFVLIDPVSGGLATLACLTVVTIGRVFTWRRGMHTPPAPPVPPPGA